MEMEKQMFDKQMFAGPRRDNGTQAGLCQGLSRPCQVPSPHIARFLVDIFGDSSIPVAAPFI